MRSLPSHYLRATSTGNSGKRRACPERSRMGPRGSFRLTLATIRVVATKIA
jgi:hypothetical protein